MLSQLLESFLGVLDKLYTGEYNYIKVSDDSERPVYLKLTVYDRYRSQSIMYQDMTWMHVIVCWADVPVLFIYFILSYLYKYIWVFCVLFSITLLYNNLILDFKEGFKESELLKEPSSVFAEANQSIFEREQREEQLRIRI